MERFQLIAASLSERIGSACAAKPLRRIRGGCSHECYSWESGRGVLFVKLAARSALDVLQAEAAGLAELASAHAVRVPRAIASGDSAGGAFLALEWIETGESPGAGERLGTALARQHQRRAPRYGWWRDNYLGRTVQQNGWLSDWAQFWRVRRLEPQLELAQRNGHATLSARAVRLLEAVGPLLSGHQPAPVLLHGDLWGGNWLIARDGEPVLCDPAVYFGDAEAELAMTRLFGGFDAEFYRAYAAVAPPSAGWQLRGELYNLYHVLNHANLFGAGYVGQAAAMMDKLLAHARG